MTPIDHFLGINTEQIARNSTPHSLNSVAMESNPFLTPPKADDLEMPELSVPPEDFEVDEKGDEQEPEPIAMQEPVEEPQTTVEETREDEIVVEDEDVGENGEDQNGHEDDNSVLSSAPESDAEANTSKTGK